MFVRFFDGVHIRFCGNGHYWFHPDVRCLAVARHALAPVLLSGPEAAYRPAWFFMRARFPVGAVECNEAAIFWLYY